MNFGKILALIGVTLVIFAWASATSIPNAANEEFRNFASGSDDPTTRSASFPELFKQMSAQRRMLQNFYVGTAGLICLAVGLNGWRKEVEPAAGAGDA